MWHTMSVITILKASVHAWVVFVFDTCQKTTILLAVSVGCSKTPVSCSWRCVGMCLQYLLLNTIFIGTPSSPRDVIIVESLRLL